jgi:4-amino-4-deoxy-L-arabinose transferase-like glycosyltransferase
MGLSLANDPRAFLGTDTGGKVATLRAMDARGDLSPNLGYWAQAFDPHGTLHPIALTDHLRGEWVNVTTLPMLYAGYPLYELGGLRAILLLPMLGGVLTALGARTLARRLGGHGDLAFWLVGLFTPVVVYSLDFWEHTLGLAAMVWGIVMLFDVADRRAGWRGALLGGALFGVAATMRTEAFVYLAATGVAVAWAARRRPLREQAGLGAAALVGLAAPLLANQGLEEIVFGTGLRSSRASGAVSGGGAGVLNRIQEALTTTFGLNDYRGALDWLIGAVMVGAFALAVVLLLDRTAHRRRLGWVALGVTVAFYAASLGNGLGFLPGLLVASPLAVVGVVVAGRRPTFRRPVGVALGALPVVWFFQYGGGANPQWGGRYELCSGLLLTVVAAVALETVPWRTVVAVAAVAGTVTGAGLAWLAERSHGFAHAVATLAAEPNPVVTTDIAHLWREGGAFYTPTRRWLTTSSRKQLPDAARVLERTGASSFTLVSWPGPTSPPIPARLGPYVRGSGQPLELVPGLTLRVTEYRR